MGKTFQKPNGGWSLVGVDAFHQLHCVYMLYKGLHQDYFDLRDTPEDIATHLDHCVDYLRQAVMCSTDITWIPVEWNTRFNRLLADFDSVHTCRNYNKIQSWMLPRNGAKHPPPPMGQPWPSMEDTDSQ